MNVYFFSNFEKKNYTKTCSFGIINRIYTDGSAISVYIPAFGQGDLRLVYIPILPSQTVYILLIIRFLWLIITKLKQYFCQHRFWAKLFSGAKFVVWRKILMGEVSFGKTCGKTSFGEDWLYQVLVIGIDVFKWPDKQTHKETHTCSIIIL